MLKLSPQESGKAMPMASHIFGGAACFFYINSRNLKAKESREAATQKGAKGNLKKKAKIIKASEKGRLTYNNY